MTDSANMPRWANRCVNKPAIRDCMCLIAICKGGKQAGVPAAVRVRTSGFASWVSEVQQPHPPVRSPGSRRGEQEGTGKCKVGYA